MSKVILGMTVSLDGFINDHTGSVAALYPDLAGNQGREGIYTKYWYKGWK